MKPKSRRPPRSSWSVHRTRENPAGRAGEGCAPDAIGLTDTPAIVVTDADEMSTQMAVVAAAAVSRRRK
ncbi:hypothetical protein M8494_20380 [Serratia ureilytica]